MNFCSESELCIRHGFSSAKKRRFPDFPQLRHIDKETHGETRHVSPTGKIDVTVRRTIGKLIARSAATQDSPTRQIHYRTIVATSKFSDVRLRVKRHVVRTQAMRVTVAGGTLTSLGKNRIFLKRTRVCTIS